MSYSYNKLWKLLIDKGMLKKDLMAKTKITSSTMAKMGRGALMFLDESAQSWNATSEISSIM